MIPFPTRLTSVVVVASLTGACTDDRPAERLAWGLTRFYPDGLVLRGELGAATARECAARGPGHR